jgi:hypothetical protein
MLTGKKEFLILKAREDSFFQKEKDLMKICSRKSNSKDKK